MLARYDNFQPFCLVLLDYLVYTIKTWEHLMFGRLDAFPETIVTMSANIGVPKDYLLHKN